MLNKIIIHHPCVFYHWPPSQCLNYPSLSGDSREILQTGFVWAALWVRFGPQALHPPQNQRPEDAPDVWISGFKKAKRFTCELWSQTWSFLASVKSVKCFFFSLIVIEYQQNDQLFLKLTFTGSGFLQVVWWSAGCGESQKVLVIKKDLEVDPSA